MNTINSRIELLKKEMAKRNLDALIIPTNDSHQSEYVADHWKTRQHFSGFTGSAGTLVVTNETASIWTDSRYFLQAETELSGTSVELKKQSIPHAPEHVGWLADNLPVNGQVGIEGLLFSTSEVDHMVKSFQAKEISMVNTDGMIDSVWADRPPLPNSEIFEQRIEYSGQSTEHKLDDVRIQMQDSNYYLVSALDDIAWVLNIRASDIEFTPVAISYLLIGKDNCRWFVDKSRINKSCLEKLENDKVSLGGYDEFIPFLEELDQSVSVMCSSADTSWSVSQQLNGRMNFCEPLIQSMKAIKNEVEIQGFRNAMTRDALALIKAFRWLESELEIRGITEFEFAQKIDEFRSLDPLYKGESFAAIVGFKGNGAIVHYKPEAETCSDIKGDGMLLVDCGAQYSDGTTDITRTICFGQPSEEKKRNYTAVFKGNLTLQRHQFPVGTNGMKLDEVARSVLRDFGLTYGHGTGHGVGSFLRVHEPPQGFATSGVTSRGTTGFKAGMVTSNEPGFYKVDEYGIRIENLMVCNEFENDRLEFEVLTLFPISTELLEVDLLEKEEVDWLNGYHKMVLEKLYPLIDEEEKKWLARKCEPI